MTALDDCNEAYLNAAAERDLYEIGYRELRSGVIAFLDFYEIGPDTETGIPEQNLRSLVTTGEPILNEPPRGRETS